MSIKEAIKAYETAKAEMQETVRKGFHGLFVDLFDDDIQSLTFRAYTPYFCDGDECVFGVYGDTDFIEINGEICEDIKPFSYQKIMTDADRALDKEICNLIGENRKPDDKYGYRWDEDGAWDLRLKKYLAAKRFSERLSEIPEECIKAFGEHIEVTVTKDGIQVEEYEDHD